MRGRNEGEESRSCSNFIASHEGEVLGEFILGESQYSSRGVSF